MPPTKRPWPWARRREQTVKELLLTLVQILLFAIFGRVIISWLLIAGIRNDFVLRLDYVLSVVTDPIMRPIRRVIPPLGMIDITPMAAIIALIVVREIIDRVL